MNRKKGIDMLDGIIIHRDVFETFELMEEYLKSSNQYLTFQKWCNEKELEKENDKNRN